MQLLTIILAACAASCVLVALARWATRGDGYWPRGPLGVLLAFIFLLGALYAVPAFIIALRQMTPVLWFVAPFQSTLPR